MSFMSVFPKSRSTADSRGASYTMKQHKIHILYFKLKHKWFPNEVTKLFKHHPSGYIICYGVATSWLTLKFFKYILFTYFYRERKGGRKRERERSTDHLAYVPQPGTWPATQAHALIRNRTGDLLVCRTTPKPLGYTSQGG